MSATFEPAPAPAGSERESSSGRSEPESAPGGAETESIPGGAESRTMRIGEVAELTGTTPRTIRYYEEIGLLSGGTERELGKHRCYSRADVDRIKEIVRLKDLLGLSLDELSQLLEAETARADIRREYRATDDPDRQHALLLQSAGHIENQLGLVRGRIEELSRLEADLSQRAALVREKLRAVS